jgi:hypothetical protein
MLDTQFICALSGIRASSEEVQEDEFPDGWIELKLTRRFVNPKWDAIQFVKQGLISQYLQNIPEEGREEQLMAIAIQVEAQFSALEAQTDKFEEEEETLYIANPDDNTQLAAEYEKFRTMIGIGKGAMPRPPVPPSLVTAENREEKPAEVEKEEEK